MGSEQSRLEMFEAEFPPPPEGETLPEIWAELGHCASGGFGPRPLDWSEMQAFAAMSGVQLPPFAWRTLRSMSAAYVAGLSDDNPLSIAPTERDA